MWAALGRVFEGDYWQQMKDIPASVQALEKAGLKPETLQARDGLACINGSNCILGMGTRQVWEMERWFKTHDIAAAMTLEALNANMKPYDERLHKIRGFAGAVTAASNIMRCVEGSDILKSKGKKVQDAYSMRSTPRWCGRESSPFPWLWTSTECDWNHEQH